MAFFCLEIYKNGSSNLRNKYFLQLQNTCSNETWFCLQQLPAKISRQKFFTIFIPSYVERAFIFLLIVQFNWFSYFEEFSRQLLNSFLKQKLSLSFTKEKEKKKKMDSRMSVSQEKHKNSRVLYID